MSGFSLFFLLSGISNALFAYTKFQIRDYKLAALHLLVLLYCAAMCIAELTRG